MLPQTLETIMCHLTVLTSAAISLFSEWCYGTLGLEYFGLASCPKSKMYMWSCSVRCSVIMVYERHGLYRAAQLPPMESATAICHNYSDTSALYCAHTQTHGYICVVYLFILL